jgi:hypothetical protein
MIPSNTPKDKSNLRAESRFQPFRHYKAELRPTQKKSRADITFF